MYDAEYQACSGGNSVEIVQCLAAKTRAHDARLNAGFKAAMGHVDAPQRELLRQAQRLWIQYRDANCRLYGASGFGLWRLLANGQIRKMVSSYIGDNALFERRCLDGQLELEQIGRAHV